jgi:hypothetical protein
MSDDLRARISKLTRDIDRAVEIGDAEPPVNGSIAFDMLAFAAMYCDGEATLTADDLIWKAEPVELANFPFAEFAEMFRIQRLEAIRRREAEQPPAPESPEIVERIERMELKPKPAPRAPGNAPRWMESGY